MKKGAIGPVKPDFLEPGLKTRLFVILLLTGLVPALFLSIIIYETAKTGIESEISSKLFLLSEAKKTQLELYLSAVQGRAVDFSSDGFIRDSLEKINKGEEVQATSEEFNRHLLNNKKPLDPALRGIIVLDKSGKIVAATDAAEIGRVESDEEYFQKGLQGPFTSSRIIHAISEVESPLTVSAPLTSKNSGELLGVIANIYDLNELNALFSTALAEQTQTPSGPPLQIHLAEGQKIILSSDLSEIAAKDAANPLIAKCASEGTGATLEYLSREGETVIGNSKCITERGWTIFAEISREDALKPITSLQYSLAATATIIAILIAVIATFLATSITTPIKKLTQTINEISTGNLVAEIDPELKESKDEIGELARAFDRTFVSLKLAMRLTSPALKKQLEKQIESETRLLKTIVNLDEAEKKLGQALKQAQSQKNELAQALESKSAAEEQLKAEKQLVDQYFALAGVMLIVLDREGTVIRANKKASDVLGYSEKELLGNSWFQFLSPKFQEHCANSLTQLLKTGGEMPCACEVQTKQGKILPSQWHDTVLTDEKGNAIGALYAGNLTGEKADPFHIHEEEKPKAARKASARKKK